MDKTLIYTVQWKVPQQGELWLLGAEREPKVAHDGHIYPRWVVMEDE